ncbi:2-amino-3,7-dideoxy-D-threo-hept-6-ulosonate synthase [Actinopolyspora erythraea]|uniref:2-amino-3,7-dideoxy-D-threo-hept-6-ulosonate synthase n=1 Tax=Actinopolyspora erythraea TaxID=414996 RepID=UPI00356B6F92
MVPLDHTVTQGPITGAGGLALLIHDLGKNGVDAVVLHKGILRHIGADRFIDTSLIVHLSASTAHAPDPNAKYLVTSVEEALRLGADAVSVHVNLGSAQEPQQITDLARVAEACDHWNLPLLAMMYVRGPEIKDPYSVELIAHAAGLAADLGVDVVKAPYPGSAAEMAEVVKVCPVPLLVVGGPYTPNTDSLVSSVEDALTGGAIGAAVGRNIFQSPDPGAVAARLATRIHHGDDAGGW